jgi:hypothetical protein
MRGKMQFQHRKRGTAYRSGTGPIPRVETRLVQRATQSAVPWGGWKLRLPVDNSRSTASPRECSPGDWVCRLAISPLMTVPSSDQWCFSAADDIGPASKGVERVAVPASRRPVPYGDSLTSPGSTRDLGAPLDLIMLPVDGTPHICDAARDCRRRR